MFSGGVFSPLGSMLLVSGVAWVDAAADCSANRNKLCRPCTRDSPGIAYSTAWQNIVEAKVCNGNHFIPRNTTFESASTASYTSLPSLNANENAQGVNITCTTGANNHIYWTFPRGVFVIDRQVNITDNTTITGAGNPNDMALASSSLTYFVKVSEYQNSLPWADTNSFCQNHPDKLVDIRGNFLLNGDNIKIENVGYQGNDYDRIFGNSQICAQAGAFETPGQIGGIDAGQTSVVTGTGVNNIELKNIRVGDLKGYYTGLSEMVLSSQQGSRAGRPNGAGFALKIAFPADNKPSSGIVIDGLVSVWTLHGGVLNLGGTDLTIKNTDIHIGGSGYSNFQNQYPGANIKFHNTVASNPSGNTNFYDQGWYTYGNCYLSAASSTMEFHNTTCNVPAKPYFYGAANGWSLPGIRTAPGGLLWAPGYAYYNKGGGEWAGGGNSITSAVRATPLDPGLSNVANQAGGQGGSHNLTFIGNNNNFWGYRGVNTLGNQSATDTAWIRGSLSQPLNWYRRHVDVLGYYADDFDLTSKFNPSTRRPTVTVMQKVTDASAASTLPVGNSSYELSPHGIPNCNQVNKYDAHFFWCCLWVQVNNYNMHAFEGNTTGNCTASIAFAEAHKVEMWGAPLDNNYWQRCDGDPDFPTTTTTTTPAGTTTVPGSGNQTTISPGGLNIPSEDDSDSNNVVIIVIIVLVAVGAIAGGIWYGMSSFGAGEGPANQPVPRPEAPAEEVGAEAGGEAGGEPEGADRV